MCFLGWVEAAPSYLINITSGSESQPGHVPHSAQQRDVQEQHHQDPEESCLHGGWQRARLHWPHLHRRPTRVVPSPGLTSSNFDWYRSRPRFTDSNGEFLLELTLSRVRTVVERDFHLEKRLFDTISLRKQSSETFFFSYGSFRLVTLLHYSK